MGKNGAIRPSNIRKFTLGLALMKNVSAAGDSTVNKDGASSCLNGGDDGGRTGVLERVAPMLHQMSVG